MGTVFISYRRADSDAIAHRIYTTLKTTFGNIVFIDVDSMPFTDFRAHVVAEVKKASVVLVIIGRNWLKEMQTRAGNASDWVRVEIETALANNIPLAPLLIGGASMPQPNELPPEIANFAYINALPVSSTEDYEYHMHRLIGRLKAEFGFRGKTTSYLHKPKAPQGLSDFDDLVPQARLAKFVGRENEIKSLHAWLSKEPKLSVRVLVGPPGVGKTRLAIELASDAEAMGWTTGFLRLKALEKLLDSGNEARNWQWEGPTLVIIDYVSRRTDALRSWIETFQDLDEEALPSSAKLRILILERTASKRSGWWSQVFGPVGGWTDRRRDICDPTEPVLLNQLQGDDISLSVIANTIERHADLGKVSANEIFSRISKSPQAEQIVGNPLMLQVAAIGLVNREPQSSHLSREDLLSIVAERERAHMIELWRQVRVSGTGRQDHLSDSECHALESLVAIITLLNGASLDAVFSILDLPEFSKRLSALSKGAIPPLLNSVLETDEMFGVSALQPDLVGEMFLLKASISPTLIVAAYKFDQVAVGSRLWQLAADFQSSPAIQATMASWIRAVIEDLSNSTMALDAFIRDNHYRQSRLVMAEIAVALRKVTQGLQNQDEICELLLHPEGRATDDARARIISKYLVREANTLTQSEKYSEALQRLNEARAVLLSSQGEVEHLWISLLQLEILCSSHLDEPERELGAIDEAIAICKHGISLSKFEEGAFFNYQHQDQDQDQEFLESKDLNKILTARGLDIVTSFSSIKDIRLLYGDFILRRIRAMGMSRAVVIEAIQHIGNMLDDKIYEKLRNEGTFFNGLANKRKEAGDAALAAPFKRAAQEFFTSAERYRSYAIYLIISLRKHVNAACKNNELELCRSGTEETLSRFNTLIKQGFNPNINHLSELFFCVAMSYKGYTGINSPAELSKQFLSLYKEFVYDELTIEAVDGFLHCILSLLNGCGSTQAMQCVKLINQQRGRLISEAQSLRNNNI